MKIFINSYKINIKIMLLSKYEKCYYSLIDHIPQLWNDLHNYYRSIIIFY